MARTTLDLDSGVLEELKRRRDVEGRPMGTIASELLSAVLAQDRADATQPGFSWKSRPMQAKVDLEDKDALWAALEA